MTKLIALGSGGMKPSTPTIGTATDTGTGTSATVAFTPSTYIGKGTITYTATSSPGNITATSATSPITVTGLTTGTAYTFTVRGTTNYGVSSDSSAASNSVTPSSPDFDLIATQTGTNVSTLTVSSIPGGYKHLMVIYTPEWGGSDSLNLRFNGNTTSSYYQVWHQQDGTNGTTATYQNLTSINLGAANSLANSIQMISRIMIADYTNTSNKPSLIALTGTQSTAGAGRFNKTHGMLNIANQPITSLTLFAGSGATMTNIRISVYGYK
jgi:hypothetical protein